MPAMIVPIALFLTSCASAPSEAQSSPEAHVIEGQGTADERSTIEASDQRMFQTEQEVVSSSAAPEPSGSAPAPSSAPVAPASPPAAP